MSLEEMYAESACIEQLIQRYDEIISGQQPNLITWGVFVKRAQERAKLQKELYNLKEKIEMEESDQTIEALEALQAAYTTDSNKIYITA